MIGNILGWTGVLLITLSFCQNIIIAAAMIKNKNTYTIMHMGCVNDSLNLVTSLVGMSMLMATNKMFHSSLKLLFLCALIYICNPISSFVLSKVGYFYNITPIDSSPRKGKKYKSKEARLG